MCFERRYPKENIVARLKSNILAAQKILGWKRHKYEHVCSSCMSVRNQQWFHHSKNGFIMPQMVSQ